jgi:hypothetical protein
MLGDLGGSITPNHSTYFLIRAFETSFITSESG